MDIYQTIHEKKGKKFLFKVETAQDLSAFIKYEKIRNEIWGAPRDRLAGPRNLGVENFFHEGSNLLTSVYAADEEGRFTENERSFMGFSYGYVGARDKKTAFRDKNNIVFYSQYIGIKEEYQNYGLGVLLKEFQKKIVLDVYGLSVIACTFDPLVSVNAYRNIHRLRMEAEQYRIDCYGYNEGKLNRKDVPSDRLFLNWNLKAEKEAPEYDLEMLLGSGQALVVSSLSEIKGVGGSVVVETAERIEASSAHEPVIVEVPFDFYRMLQETSVSDERVRRIPLDWRTVTREAFLDLFQRGCRILDFNTLEQEGRRRGFYVFSAMDRDEGKSFHIG